MSQNLSIALLIVGITIMLVASFLDQMVATRRERENAKYWEELQKRTQRAFDEAILGWQNERAVNNQNRTFDSPKPDSLYYDSGKK